MIFSHQVLTQVKKVNVILGLTYFNSFIKFISWKTLPNSSLTRGLLNTWVFLNIFLCSLDIWIESSETVFALVTSFKRSAVEDDPEDSEIDKLMKQCRGEE